MIFFLFCWTSIFIKCHQSFITRKTKFQKIESKSSFVDGVDKSAIKFFIFKKK